MSGTNTFFNAMQWWNDELQTAHLRQIEQSLNANIYALREAQAQGSVNQQAQKQKEEAAKNSVFSARQLLDEVQEQIEEQPNNALFLYVKVMDAISEISVNDFSDLSDKEYFYNVSKKYKVLGEELKQIFGEEYIDHLKYYDDTHTVYRYLHNIALIKDVLNYVKAGDYKGVFGVNKGKLKDGLRSIGRERNRLSAVEPFCRQIDRDGVQQFSNNLSNTLNQLIQATCQHDHYGLVSPDMLDAIAPDNMHMFIEPLEQISQEVREKSREHLGLEIVPFGKDFFDKP